MSSIAISSSLFSALSDRADYVEAHPDQFSLEGNTVALDAFDEFLDGDLRDPVLRLSATKMTTTLQSEDGDKYTVTIAGAGFKPVSSLRDLMRSLQNGTTDGTINSIDISHGRTAVLGLSLSRTGYTLQSGGDYFKVGGKVLNDFDDLRGAIGAFSAVTMFDTMTENQRQNWFDDMTRYGVNSLTVGSGKTEIFKYSVTATKISFAIAGVTLSLEGQFPTTVGAALKIAYDIFNDMQNGNIPTSSDLGAFAITKLLLTDATGVALILATGPFVEGEMPSISIDDVIMNPDALADFDANNVVGTEANDVLFGNPGDDVIDALGGDDFLSATSGNDTLNGGAGNDIYIIDSTSDVVTELEDAGWDTVRSEVSITLAANVEALELTESAANGTGNALDNLLTGNDRANSLSGGEGDDQINGGAGRDTLNGGAGNDVFVFEDGIDLIVEQAGGGTADTVESNESYTLVDNVENLVLTGSAAINGTGNSAANEITGNAAANVLSGGAGADTMAGGDGNDTYIVDDGGDVVTEVDGQGSDSVKSSVSYILTDFVETLVLTGSGTINATGNALDNVLTGNDKANVLDGLGGADTLVGGLGGDTYVIDNAGDVITENGRHDVDTVRSSISFTLSSALERLELTGTDAINGTGNDSGNGLTGNSAANALAGRGGDDVISGGDGADTITGGTGTDRMTGDAGEDVFVFTSTSESSKSARDQDVILGFVSGEDTIDLHAIDANSRTRGVNEDFTFIGSASFTKLAGQLRYASGVVQVDTNGDGKADMQFSVSGNPTLVADDFIL